LIELHSGARVGAGGNAEADIAAEAHSAVSEVELGMNGALVGLATVDDVVVVIWSGGFPIVVEIGAAIDGHDAEGVVEGAERVAGVDEGGAGAEAGVLTDEEGVGLDAGVDESIFKGAGANDVTFSASDLGEGKG